jgi:cytochrome c556
MIRSASIALAALALAAPAASQDMSPAERAHALRMGHMNLYVANLGPLVQMARGEMEYDAAMAELHARNIAAYAQVDLTPLWAEGSSSEDLEDSRALPAIWDNLEDVASQQADLAEAAEAAANAAGDGQEAFVAAFRQVGEACGACHEDYREPDEE